MVLNQPVYVMFYLHEGRGGSGNLLRKIVEFVAVVFPQENRNACTRQTLICVVTLGLDPRLLGFLHCFSTAKDDISSPNDLRVSCTVNYEMDLFSGDDVLAFLVEVWERGFEFTQQGQSKPVQQRQIVCGFT